MGIYNRRVQAVLSDDQFARLSRLAAEAGEPISVMVRKAIETTYLQPDERRRRRDALSAIVALNAPVGDWEQMEEEITRGAVEGLP
ncbi:MAG: hypothetical protein HY329_04395 [Chloroflexi bacterium]|nr:hypothetical protein [Chloroflexota bacterium]